MELLEFATQVAEHLDGWTLATEQPQYNRTAYLDGPDGTGLVLTGDGYDWVESGRVKVHGRYPPAARINGSHWSFCPRDAKTIGASIARGPEAVARDIERRLLPMYLEQYREAQENREAALLREQDRLAALWELAEAGGECAETDSAELVLRISANGGGRAYGRVEVYVGRDGTDVHLDIRSIPFERAKAMLAVLAERSE